MEKLTYVNAINYALRAINGETLTESEKVAVAEKLIALGQSLEKRNTKSGKPTAKQVANGNTKAEILRILADTPDLKCGEIAEKLGISGQKCSALLTQLVNTEQVTKWQDKRVTYFALADHGVEALPCEITV